MTNLAIAKKLEIDPKVLERESIKTYLEKQLRYLEAELYTMSIKYGVEDFDKFQNLMNKGKIHEGDKNWDDYYKFENFQHKRNIIYKILKPL